MDPEIYVFPRISTAPLKIAASTGLFVVVLVIARLVLQLVPGPHLWAAVDRNVMAGPLSTTLMNLLHLLLGYGLFIYGSYRAWQATRQKNTVEDPRRQSATRLLDTGDYGRVRHPMYGMFILANTGLGLALNSVYGLAFALLSLVAFVANGLLEERLSLIPQFGSEYWDYMRRVPARYFTPGQTFVLALTLIFMTAGVILG
jgi:protein-S-isoprenylcysteine O-methyltransferase Ste14